VSTEGEYHTVRNPTETKAEREDLIGRPYGLGPRVPMYVVSPWSRGGWVNSQVFDHTSVIRFVGARFGAPEPNISAWRNAVCGDLTSAFDFKTPNREPRPPRLPATATVAARAAALPNTTLPPIPATPTAPVQATGARPSRALPYDLDVMFERTAQGVNLTFLNRGAAGAVFHVYEPDELKPPPRRYTVEARKTLTDSWQGEEHDLWILGPGGFHRRFRGGDASGLRVATVVDEKGRRLILDLQNKGRAAIEAVVTPQAYAGALRPWRARLAAGAKASHAWPLEATKGWYDLAVTTPADPGFLQRFAGRLENGRPSTSDPAMGGAAVMVFA
jgi:phospholipase C